MTRVAVQTLVVTASVLAVVLSVVGPVALVRWRRRNASLIDSQGARWATVSRTLRRGGAVEDDDRPLGVLVAEQVALGSLPLVGILVLCASQVVRAVALPDGATAVLLVLLVSAGGIALGTLSTCGRILATARRQGIRPGRLW